MVCIFTYFCHSNGESRRKRLFHECICAAIIYVSVYYVSSCSVSKGKRGKVEEECFWHEEDRQCCECVCVHACACVCVRARMCVCVCVSMWVWACLCDMYTNAPIFTVLCQPFRLTATALKLVVSALKGEHPMMCKAASEPSSKELGWFVAYICSSGASLDWMNVERN